jgi:hypothetical protein
MDWSDLAQDRDLVRVTLLTCKTNRDVFTDVITSNLIPTLGFAVNIYECRHK